jgi:hypothetical protein
MRASARRAVLLTAALGAACVTRTRRVAPSGATAAALGTPDMVQEMARQALLLDAKGDRGADTLYAPEAAVVANARVRLATRFAWVLVDYRWINSERNQAEAGRATFVCEQKPKGWRIVHVHSSQILPWDR